MNFLYLCSPYPLRFVSTASLSLNFSDSMKHYRVMVGVAVDLSMEIAITELALSVKLQEARGSLYRYSL
jgi:hypothetical protein